MRSGSAAGGRGRSSFYDPILSLDGLIGAVKPGFGLRGVGSGAAWRVNVAGNFSSQRGSAYFLWTALSMVSFMCLIAGCSSTPTTSGVAASQPFACGGTVWQPDQYCRHDAPGLDAGTSDATGTLTECVSIPPTCVDGPCTCLCKRMVGPYCLLNGHDLSCSYP